MRKYKVVIYFLLFFSVVSLCSCISSNSERTVGLETPKYSVFHKQGKFEIRQYEAYIVAETIVESDFENVGNIGFRRLFKYISGHNRKKESIKMTAPVSQEAASEKIQMTAPVNQQKVQDKYAVSFLMPSKYTMQTLPTPLDPSIILKVVPGRNIAAVRYSGTWTRNRYEVYKSRLQEFIEKRDLQPKGDAIWARYDPPFQLWFLRRNEVLIPIE
jgi:hypothetical protein